MMAVRIKEGFRDKIILRGDDFMSHKEDKKQKKRTGNKRPNPDTIYEEEMKKQKTKGAIY